jgi:DNA primase
MPNWVNFADIRKRVSIEDVLLRYYRITNLKRDGTKLSGPCPVHDGDSPRSFHVELDKNIWHCFSKCQGGGNQLDLVAKKEHISIRDAALRLQTFFSVEGKERTESVMHKGKESAPESIHRRENESELRKESSRAKQKEEEPEVNQPLHIKLELKSDHPHLLDDRGLKLGTTERFGVGYCSRGILRGMIAIPIHDEEGELVAYAGRRLKPVDIRELGKYKFPKGFRKELVLYNLNRAKEHQKESGLILVEGFFSVLKLYEAGLPNVVASMGCELSDEQARLCAEAKEVIVLYDGNDAGYIGAAKAKAKLAPLVPVRIVKLEEGTEPESYSPQALRWLVNGISRLDIEEITFSRRRPNPDSRPHASAAV